MKWKPSTGEYFYYVEFFYWGGFVVGKDTWVNSVHDGLVYRNGNCFKTKAEAEKMLKEIKKLLRGKK